MSKIRGFATLLVLALSLVAVSCSGPVFFKPPVASVATTAPSAPGQAVAVAGAPAAAVAGSATTQPAAAAASTQPSSVSPIVAYLAAIPLNGFTIFALFTLALLLTIGFLNFMFSGYPVEKKPK